MEILACFASCKVVQIYFPVAKYTYPFWMYTDSGSVASYAPLHSSSLATQRFQALSSINQTLLRTNPSLTETNHARAQSLDLGREDTAASSARNSDIDYTLNQASSFKSIISDTESWNFDKKSAKDEALATELLSPNRQVMIISLF